MVSVFELQTSSVHELSIHNFFAKTDTKTGSPTAHSRSQPLMPFDPPTTVPFLTSNILAPFALDPSSLLLLLVSSYSALASDCGCPSACRRMRHLDLDECIEKLKRGLPREEILEAICEPVKEVLMRESNIVHVHGPITIVGDIHESRPSPCHSLD